MQAITLISQLATDFGDDAYVLISKSEWAQYLNDAQRQVALVRPDSSQSVTSFQLVAGTKQTIPSNGLRLLSVIRNMGSDGATPGRIITMVDRATLDLYDRDWHNATASSPVDSCVLDEKMPKTFYVTPPVPSSPAVYIEANISVLPTEVSDPDNDLIALDDIYVGPLRHWMMHRAYNRESDSPGSQQQASFHLQAFYQSLGIKTRTDMGFSPSTEMKQEVLQ